MCERISECCGAEDRSVGIDGPDFSDLGICPDCQDHCEFEEVEEGPLVDDDVDKAEQNYWRDQPQL
jgi:hypothetical protein